MEKLNPNMPEDMQDMQLKPVVFGPPRHGSPDPDTERLSLNDAVSQTAEHAADEPREVGDDKKKKSTAKKDD